MRHAMRGRHGVHRQFLPRERLQSAGPYLRQRQQCRRRQHRILRRLPGWSAVHRQRVCARLSLTLRLAGGLVALTALLSLSLPAGAKPPKREPPLLFGGPTNKPKLKAPLDPRLPTGAPLPATQLRPVVTASRCSFVRPVCVHATSAAAEASLPDALT